MKSALLLLVALCLSFSDAVQGQEPQRKTEAIYASEQPDARLTGLIGLTAAYSECQSGILIFNGVIAEVTLTEPPDSRIKSVAIDIDGILGRALGGKIREIYNFDERIYTDAGLPPRDLANMNTLLAKGKRISFTIASCGKPAVERLNSVIESSQPPTKEDDGMPRIFREGFTKTEVNISNETDRVLTIVLGRGRYRIGAGRSQMVTLEPGSYNYRASAPGLVTIAGKRTFERGYSYTWSFRRAARPVPVPRRRR